MAEQQSQQEIDEEEWNDKANWRFSLFYYSERDSRPWVPKRSMFGRRRFGGTPNFAKKSARQYMMIILGLAFVFFVLIASLGRG